jgi:hypothetical protein
METSVGLENNTYKPPCGAEVRTGVRRQNPAGKSLLGPLSAGFLKGTRPQRLRLLKYQKSTLFSSMQRKISVGSGGTAAYFGKRSGPGLGSWHQSPTLSTYS